LSRSGVKRIFYFGEDFPLGQASEKKLFDSFAILFKALRQSETTPESQCLSLNGR
jgi:hypothetical protein